MVMKNRMSVPFGRRGVAGDYGHNLGTGSGIFLGGLFESGEERLIWKLGWQTGEVLSTTATVYGAP